jgi:dTDP-4-amino-4,6-dideoxygalactose transaminase
MSEPTQANPIAVPFFDLKAQLRGIRGEIDAALAAVLDDGGYSNGPATALFEQEFAHAIGAPHCVAVNTGTSALHLALRVLDVGPGDEVITVAMSFVATAWPILYAGAHPVFVDVDPVRMTMDPDLLERAITARTKAIIVVHLYGQPADLSAILPIARAHGVPVIEDCAQAVGATLEGKHVGTLGVLGCFSFYPSKNLGAYGEGGAVTTGDPALAERLERLRNHAQSGPYLHEEIGYNYRLNSFQGAVLSVKLRHLEAWTERRIALAARYGRELAGTGLRLPAPGPAAHERHVFHLYVVRHPRREAFRARLRERGIETAVHYPRPIHLQPVMRAWGGKEGDLPVTEDIARSCVSLPLYPEMPDADQDRVVTVVREVSSSARSG